jgi:hypothetical protein
LSFWKNATDCFLEDRKLIEKENYIDISFKDFVANPLEQALSVYQALGLEINQQNKKRMKNYIYKQTQQKRAQHNYALKDFGLRQEKIEDLFKEYRTKFDL